MHVVTYILRLFFQAGTEGFRHTFGTFSETNFEIKYKNIAQNFVEKLSNEQKERVMKRLN